MIDGTVPQYTGTALTGGVWGVFNGASLKLPTTGTGIVTNQADITLSGAGSSLTAGGGTLEAKLATNSGALRILAGKTFNAAKPLTNNGIIQVNAATLSAPSITVSGMGSILSGSGTVNVSTGPLTVNANGILQGGDGTTGTTLTIGGASGALTLASNSIIQLALGPTGTHSTLTRNVTTSTWSFQSNQAFKFLDLGAQVGAYNDIITGLNGLSIDPSGWTITSPGFAGTFTFDGTTIDLNLTAVPEPATWIGGTLVAITLASGERRRIARRRRTLA